MEMQQVRYFLTLARTLNFTRAAEECNVTQPALTRAIKALEAELGGELLRREHQHSHLTELGTRMLPLLQQCYDSAQSAKALADAIKTGEVAPLSLVLSHTVNMGLFRELLAELSRAFPGIKLNVRRVSGSDITQALKSGDVELAIAGPLDEEWDRLDTWPIFDDPFALFVNEVHALATRNNVDAEQLSGERLLMWRGCEMINDLLQSLSERNIEIDPAHQVETDQDLVAMLGANLGIAIVPVSGLQAPGLRHLPVEGIDLKRTVAVYGVAGRKRSPAATTLLNLLRAANIAPEV